MSAMRPNSTQIPDVILDEWMPHLSGSELAIVMMVARKTFGWRKGSDRIGISQMTGGTGLSRRTVQAACDSLEVAHVLTICPAGDGVTASEYSLNIDDAAAVSAHLRTRSGEAKEGGAKFAPVQKMHGGGAKFAPGGAQNLHPQQTLTTNTLQQTEEKECTASVPAAIAAPTTGHIRSGNMPILFDMKDECGNQATSSEPETVASACKSLPEPEKHSEPEPAKPPGAPRRSRGLDPGDYTSQAMIDFDRMFVRQRRLDEKSVRHPIRDLKLEAEAQRRYDAVGPEQFDRALHNFFSCFDGTDPYVASEGFRLSLFIRQFEKWEGGQAASIRQRPRGKPESPNKNSPQKTGQGSSQYLSAAQLMEQREREQRGAENR